jgi:hypothetical protein
MFAIENGEGIFEVEMCKVGYECNLFFVYLAKLLQSSKFVTLYLVDKMVLIEKKITFFRHSFKIYFYTSP